MPLRARLRSFCFGSRASSASQRSPGAKGSTQRMSIEMTFSYSPKPVCFHRTNDDSNDVASDFISFSSAARSRREIFVISSSDASTHNGRAGEARAK